MQRNIFVVRRFETAFSMGKQLYAADSMEEAVKHLPHKDRLEEVEGGWITSAPELESFPQFVI